MQTILNSLLEERGSLSLEHLRELPVDQIKTQLSKYKVGFGPTRISQNGAGCAWQHATQAAIPDALQLLLCMHSACIMVLVG